MGSRLSSLTVALAAATAFACSGPGSTNAAPTSPIPAGCRAGPPEASVYNPDRLKVLDPCKHAAGIVVDVAHEDDGDYHVWFKVDAGYEYLLNASNHFQARPAMLAEITPDCPLSANPPDAKSAAKCPRSHLPIPDIGDHVQLYGPWVLDTDHGWREIHPVDWIQIG